MEYEARRWPMPAQPRRVETFAKTTTFESPPEAVFDLCRSAESFLSIFPEPVTSTRETDEFTLRDNGVYVFRHWMRGRVPVKWVILVTDFRLNERFTDVQLRGPFRWFRHQHLFEPCESGTRYSDRIEYSTIGGRRLDAGPVARELSRVFDVRHARMASLLGLPA